MFQRVASFIRIPLTRWYLRKDRFYRYRNIEVMVRKGVFHPGIFPSTRMLLTYFEKVDLRKKTFLELGCGSGLLSIFAHTAGAEVTASDLSAKALKNAEENAKLNSAGIHFIHSDLFERIPPFVFDWIVINPPYYQKDPANEDEMAWYCGKDFEYFRQLFGSLAPYLNHTSTVLLTFTGHKNLYHVQAIAKENGFDFALLTEKNSLFDGKDYLFQIKPVQANPF